MQNLPKDDKPLHWNFETMQPLPENEIQNSHLNSDQKDLSDEHIIIMSSIAEMKKRFLRENLVVWCDSKIEEEKKDALVAHFQPNWILKTYANPQEVAKLVEKDTTPCIVISSESIREKDIPDISRESHVFSIYIYCKNAKTHIGWARDSKKVKVIKENIKDVIEDMKCHILEWEKKEEFLKKDFPIFSPIFDDTDKTYNNYLHVYLIGLLQFNDRLKAKNDFIRLARAVYGEEDMENFHNDYQEHDLKKVFGWYSKESFFYKLVNNALRLADSDIILSCRLPLKDLEVAIKEQYQKKSKNYNGLLYRQAYISDEEWKKLEENHGRDIEMYGFLSTSKKKDIATSGIQLDYEKKMLVTIIVPSTLDGEGQGFAEIQEFSFHDEEDEVLFNIRSRFTVLETTTAHSDGIQYRHLILLYGNQLIKRFLKNNDPTIDLTVTLGKEPRSCLVCQDIIRVDENIPLFVNVANEEELVCYKCVKQGKCSQLPVLACVNPKLEIRSGSETLSTEIQGTITRYDKKLDLPNYRHMCGKHENISCCSRIRFICTKCERPKREWCEKCFELPNECLDAQHVIVVESQPYTFWNEKMTTEELNNFEHKYDLYNQGHVFFETQQYERAKEYFQKRLESNKDSIDLLRDLGKTYWKLREIHKAIQQFEKILTILEKGEFELLEFSSAYNSLGLLHGELGKHKEAVDYFLNAIGLCEAIGGDIDKLVSFYNNLGVCYRSMGKIDEAIKCVSKGREMVVSKHKEDHPRTALFYHNLGYLFLDLGEFSKAAEYLKKAVNLTISVHGDQHPLVAVSYYQLGKLYIQLKHFKPAEEYISKALSINKLVYTDEHPLSAHCYSLLGKMLNEQGDLKKAREYNEKALEICQRIHGENHLDTALSHNNLGLVYKNLRELDKASEHFLAALDITQKIGEEKDPRTAYFYTNLGYMCTLGRQKDKSIELCTIAIEKWKSVYGENHPELAVFYNNLGSAYKEAGQAETGLKYYLEALRINELAYEDPNPDIATSHGNVGVVYNLLGHREKAIEHVSKCLEMSRIIYGDQHPETMACRDILQGFYDDQDGVAMIVESDLARENELVKAAMDYYESGIACMGEGKLVNAIECILSALDITKSLPGNNNLALILYYNDLGRLYEDTDQFEKAKECYLNALEITKIEHGKKPVKVVECYLDIARMHRQLGQLQKAVESTLSALDIFESLDGDQTEQIAYCHSYLLVLYRELGQVEKVNECRANLERIAQLMPGRMILKFGNE